MPQDMNTRYGHNNIRHHGAGISLRYPYAIPTLFLRYIAILLLMMVVGVNCVWGQTDYSGTYYIASNYILNKKNQYDPNNLANNYYLCPTEEWAFYVSGGTVTGTDNGQPFITTHKRASGDEAKYKWIVEKHTIDEVDYYSFKYGVDYIEGTSTYTRYMSYSRKLSGAGVDRMRIHLEKTANPGDNELFRIVVQGSYLVISPKNEDVDESDATHKTKYLTVNGGNKESYGGESGKTGGPSGYTNTAGVIGTYWDITDVNAPFYLEEVISRPTITNTSSQILMSHSEEGTTIYYTTDGTNPSSTNCTGSGQAPLQIDMLESSATLKAVAAKSDNFPSCISKIRVVPAASITLAQTEYTYTGSGMEPAVSSVMDGETPIDASEYTVSYSNNTNASNAATVTITDNAGGDYIVYGSTTFTINPVGVTLTANSGSVAYDGTEKTLNGFTCNVDNLTFTGVTASGSGTNIGDYPVTFTGVTIGTKKDTSGNYVVTATTDGTLTITPKPLTITAGSDTKVYDGTALTKNSYTSEGLMAGDMIESVTITGSQTNAGTSNNVPSAAVIKKGDEVVNANYTITYTNGTLEVTKKPLTITAEAKSKIYGEADPELTYTSEGLINDDAITGALARAEGENVGTYAINQGTLTAGDNYAITFTPGTLTVNPKEVGITWSETPLVYNGSEQAPTATVTGTVNSDVIGVTVTGGQTNAGTDYTATASALTGAKAGNYALPDANTHTFAIGKKAMTVTADAKSKTYGDADPELTYTTSGLVEGDELTGALDRAEGENAGSYAITQGTLDNSHNPNYTITFTAGKIFTITPKSLGDNTNPAENITIDITEANVDHVIVKQGGKELTAGTDYSITPTGSASDKYYKVTITGANNYTGSFKATFANVTFGTKDYNHYWGTFVSDNSDGDFAVPSNMEAYIVTGINTLTGMVEVEQLDNIPDHEPVLLMTNKNAHGFVVKAKNNGTAPTGTNMLVEATGDEEARTFGTAKIYLLYKGEFVFNAAGTLPAGKVYLPMSSGAALAPARLSINWAVTTGIDNSQLSTFNSQLSGTWYTIEGIKLNDKPTKKGLYLRDGKKVVVR